MWRSVPSSHDRRLWLAPGLVPVLVAVIAGAETARANELPTAPGTAVTQVRQSLATDGPGLLMLVSGLLLLAFYLAVWLALGRDRPRGTIIPLFEPPRQVSPAAARFLSRWECDAKTLAVALIDVAVHDGMSIRRSGAGVYALTRATGRAGRAADEAEQVVDLLLTQPVTELRPANQASVRAAQDALDAALGRRFEGADFFRNDRYLFVGWVLWAVCLLAVLALDRAAHAAALAGLWIWTTVWLLAGVGLVLAVPRRWKMATTSDGRRLAALGGALLFLILTMWVVGFGAAALWKVAALSTPARAAALVLITGLNALFYTLLKAPTAEGRTVMDQLEGFRMFLSAAGPDQRDSPEQMRALFESYLPYAVALDVELEWAAHFRTVLAPVGGTAGYAPAWFQDDSGDRADRLGMVLALGDGLAEAIAYARHPPPARAAVAAAVA